MRGGTPMNGRGGGCNAWERPSAAARIRLLALLRLPDANKVLIDMWRE
jgi:hypothetical protein